jgi:hypothetical protein
VFSCPPSWLAAFRAAATLEHEAPVPIGGRRETHLEAVAVRISVNTDALVDDPLHLTVIGKRDATCGRAAAGVEFRNRDLGCAHREIGESCELRARRGDPRRVLGKGGLCANTRRGDRRRGAPSTRSRRSNEIGRCR